MLKYISQILVLLLLSSCSEQVDFSTPAQNHINEYRSKHQECKTQDYSKPLPDQTLDTTSHQTQSTDVIFALQSEDVILGNPQSSVIVIEYSSPSCTHCAYFHKAIYPELQKKYIDTAKIAYVIRPFITNKQDLDAAVLAKCGAKEKFVDLLDIFYKQQESWAFNANYREILTNIGQLIGITPEQYAICLNDETMLQPLINHSRAISRVPTFIGTPAFVINGEFYSKSYSLQNLANAIDAAIKSSAL
jgi:protein-disulfide isomerase